MINLNCIQLESEICDFHLQREAAHFKELREMIKKFDVDKSGYLDAEELTNCLKTYEEGLRKDSQKELEDDKPLQLTPTKEEISLILNTVCRKREKKLSTEPEMQMAIDLWHSYVSNREAIDRTFKEYDTNHSQKLEKDQLTRYLTMLNGGVCPEVVAKNSPFDFLLVQQ